MRISEAASLSGLGVETIRFYERSGLLPPIERGLDGNRRFSAHDIEWLVLISALRETGMPLKTMRHFAELYRHGDRTLPERKEVLQEHAKQLAQRQLALNRCAELLDHKLQLYAKLMEVPA